MASELVDALTLDELVARHGPFPVRRVAQLGLDLLDALAAAHTAGLAHLELELDVRSPRHHVAMAISTRDRDWGAGWALFEAFKASFAPPS